MLLFVLMSEVVLLLPNTDHLQQVEDNVRGCSTSTKYWPPSTRWWLCQSLFYFYQILTTFNKMTIMSEVVLLLPNTDRLQQVEDYVIGCSTSTKYRSSSTCWRLYQRLSYFYQEQPLTKSSICWRRSVFGRSRTTSDIIFNLLKTVSIW
jgi:hypothetical protein